MYKEESKMENAILIPANMLQFSMEPQMARPNNLVELGKKLLESSQNGETDDVRLLMSRGAPFTTDWLGTSPLHMAAMNGHLATCEILLRSGISRDARTKVDKTPLHIAAQEGHTDIVELLLDNGADVDCQDLLRMTPLHWAVEREHIETIKVLLQHGANPNCVSKFDKTAFRIAMENNRPDLVELLQNVLPNSTNSTAQDERQSVAMEMTEIHDVTHQEEVETSGIKEDEGSSDSSHPRMQRVYLQASDLLRTAQEGRKEETDTHNTSTLQLLQAHGITMLPADDHTLVASAVKSGQTVVLTEAGKMALNLMADASHNSLEPPRKKMITIRTGAGPGGRTPNILKRAAPIADKSPTKVLLRTAPKPLETTISSNSSDDLAEIKRQLEEAQREANTYRVLLSRKEREAEQYRQQLQSITQKIQ